MQGDYCAHGLNDHSCLVRQVFARVNAESIMRQQCDARGLTVKDGGSKNTKQPDAVNYGAVAVTYKTHRTFSKYQFQA